MNYRENLDSIALSMHVAKSEVFLFICVKTGVGFVFFWFFFVAFFTEIMRYSTHKQKLFLQTELPVKKKEIQETQSASLLMLLRYMLLRYKILYSWKTIFSQMEAFHGFRQDFCKGSWLVFRCGDFLFWVCLWFFF